MVVLAREYIFNDHMNSPLIVDHKDPKYFFLEQVLAQVSNWKANQIFGKNKFEPIPAAGEAVKIVLVEMFFSLD